MSVCDRRHGNRLPLKSVSSMKSVVHPFPSLLGLKQSLDEILKLVLMVFDGQNRYVHQIFKDT